MRIPANVRKKFEPLFKYRGIPMWLKKLYDKEIESIRQARKKHANNHKHKKTA